MGTAAILASLLAAPVRQADAQSPEQFLASCRERGRAATAFLATKAAWTPENKPQLMDSLRVVGLVRPDEAIPVLVAHITYRDNVYGKLEQTQQTPPELEYPVYGVLRQYGAAAIPALIAHLKRPGPVVDDLDSARELYLSALLLRGLSDDPKVGKAMARARIQRELDRFPQADFPRLKAVLARPLLR